EDFALLAEIEQIAAEYIDQPAVGVEDRNDVHPLVEQLENLFTGGAGPRPYKIAVDAARDLALDRYSRQQSAADVAVGDGADDTPLGVPGKQDSEHVGIEPLECLLDRVALGDGKVALVRQCEGSKGNRFRPSGPETPLFRIVRYGRGGDRASSR
ncbi:MAG: hypothetical protein K0Q64_2436, partial [Nitrobacter vulgaris]|nr:hypothetical protein [Nitrobacter vulgaris]